jgi:hypothetical protein
MIGSPTLWWDGPGLARGCGAGLTLRSHLPAGSGLTVGSTSVFGLRATPGDHELGKAVGSVEVPVKDEADACITLTARPQHGSPFPAKEPILRMPNRTPGTLGPLRVGVNGRRPGVDVLIGGTREVA